MTTGVVGKKGSGGMSAMMVVMVCNVELFKLQCGRSSRHDLGASLSFGSQKFSVCRALRTNDRRPSEPLLNPGFPQS